MLRKSIISLALATAIAGIYFILSYKDAIIANRNNHESYPFYTTGLNDEHLIAHAGGAFENNIYTNSLEAVEGSIKEGRKFIEIDLLETTDGKYIAGHDWELVNKMVGRSGDKPMSSEEFLSAKLYGKYTPMGEKQIVELFEKYPDWIMVTDKSRDVTKIARTFPYPDRMIVQVFGLVGYMKALKLGLKYPTLRLKGGRRGVKEIYKVFMDWINVKSVILGEKSFDKNRKYIKELHDKGITVILYGNPRYQIVDNPEEIKKYAGEYIDLVDTDFLKSL